MRLWVLAFVFVSSGLFSIAAAQPQPAKIKSFYSTTAKKSVAVLEDSELEKDPDIDHFTHLCPGYGGFELIHRGGDLRSAIDVKYGKKVSGLLPETHKHSPGAFPHKANDVVEWRGILEGQNFVPHAIIYRLAASADIDGGAKQVTKTVLVVVALRGGDAKVLGAVSGKNEHATARALADSALKPD